MSDSRQYERIDSELERSWGFSVTRAGYYHVGPDTEPEPVLQGNFQWQRELERSAAGHKLPHHFLHYTLSGAGTFETHECRHDLAAGDLYFWQRDTWGRHKTIKETGREVYWVGFSGSYIEEYVCPNLFSGQSGFVRRVGYLPELVKRFEQILSYASNGSRRSQLLSQGILMELFAFAVGVPAEPTDSSSSRIIDLAIDFMRQNLFNEIDFPALAQSYSMSYGRFRAVFKSSKGISPYQFLLNARLDCARRLLKDHTLSIKSVAFKSGFNSQANFCKIVKRKTGMSPSELRWMMC